MRKERDSFLVSSQTTVPINEGMNEFKEYVTIEGEDRVTVISSYMSKELIEKEIAAVIERCEQQYDDGSKNYLVHNMLCGAKGDIEVIEINGVEIYKKYQD